MVHRRIVFRIRNPSVLQYGFAQNMCARMLLKVNTTDKILIPGGMFDTTPQIQPTKSIFWKFKSG